MRSAGPALLCLLVLLAGCGAGSDSPRTAAREKASAEEGSAAPNESAEASIEDFGAEAEGRDREELLATFHGYLGAIAAGDEEAACSYLGANVEESLEQLSSQAKKQFTCAQLLEALLSPQADEIAKSQDEGEIRKVRFEGDTAFVVFHAPGARLYQLNLGREDDEWKVASLSATVLAPSLSR